jgi:hypothetical protein
MDDFAYAPIACSIFTGSNAVSRMRGANISRSSEGTLPIESVRTFPSESVSGGIHQCQVGGLSGSEVESRRFPNCNANVASALQICSTTGLIASGISWAATMTSLTGVSCVQRSFPNGLIRKKITPPTGWVP